MRQGEEIGTVCDAAGVAMNGIELLRLEYDQ